MNDFRDLKAIAEACQRHQPLRFMRSHGALYIRNDNGIVFDVHQNRSFPEFMAQNKDYADLVLAANPETILALIAENEALAGVLRRFVNGEHEQDENQAERHMYFTEAQSLLALVGGELKEHTIVPDSAIKAIHAERDQLKAENEILTKNYKSLCDSVAHLNVAATSAGDEVARLKAENNRLQSAANTLARIGYTDHGGELWKPPIGQKPNFDQIDQLRAEVAGLKTGYEAYERVNAELKAENEALRKLAPSKEIIWCACGDGYPVNSHGAGFMDANEGVCANCDAAMGQGEQP